MDNQRTAIDILLSLENNLEILSKRIQNSENLLKILLSKFNTVKTVNLPQEESKASSEVFENIINKDNFDNRVKTNKFAELAKTVGIDVDKEDTKDENSNISNTRNSRVKSNKETKHSVSQVLTNNGNAVYLANIEILNENGEILNQTRTNTKGKWLMALTPGNYQVHVHKKYPQNSNKESIDKRYNINISQSDSPIELNPLSLDSV